MQIVDLIQWPAMALTLLASWWVASRDPKRRNRGFWLFLASNVAWIAWGVGAHAYALVLLQVGLILLNIRGMRKTDDAAAGQGT